MNTEQNDEPKELKFDLEVAPIEAITRAEVDVQIATAHQYPRSLTQFYKRAEAMVTMDVETAESCLYRLTRREKGGCVKVIEGESIRMAEIVASCYGNLRSAVQVSGHTPTRVSVRAVCHDLETNNLIAVEKQAKTTYSDGTPYNEDMSVMIANSTVSKALRDAIFRVVPKALTKPLLVKARELAFGDAQGNRPVPFKTRVTKAMVWAQSLGIDLSRVYNVIGVKGEEDITLEHLEMLTGLKTAIKDKEQTVDEAFPRLESETTKPIFTNPAKQEQEQQKAAEKPTTTAPEKPKTKAKTEPAVTPKTEPTPAIVNVARNEPPPVESKAPEPVKEEKAAATTLPSNPPAQPVQEQTLPLDQPAPVPEPAKPPGQLTANQQNTRTVVEGAGFTWADFSGWATVALPAFKKAAPADWSQIPDKTADLCATQSKGVIAGIKNWKAKG